MILGTPRSRKLALSIGLGAIAFVVLVLAIGIGGFVWTQWHRANVARHLVAHYENLLNRQKETSKLLVGSNRRQEIARYFLTAPNAPAAAAGLQQLVSGLDGFRALTIQELSAAPRDGKPDEITLTLSAAGELRDITQLLAEINSLSPHLFIESFALSRTRAGDRQASQAQLSIRLYALFEKGARA